MPPADRPTHSPKSKIGLGSEHEKVVHCGHGLGVHAADLPQLAFETAGLQTVRYFPDKLSRNAAAKRAFGSPRFFEAYRDWLKRGDVAFASLRSPRLSELWRRGDWRLDILVLPHDYEHLSPSLAIA